VHYKNHKIDNFYCKKSSLKQKKNQAELEDGKGQYGIDKFLKMTKSSLK
jgi:hypothetical protein